jgi:hypothetical protein
MQLMAHSEKGIALVAALLAIMILTAVGILFLQPRPEFIASCIVLTPPTLLPLRLAMFRLIRAMIRILAIQSGHRLAPPLALHQCP